MTAPRPRSRQPKQLDAGMFQAEINSFALRLAAEGKAAKTIRTYTEAVQWFAATGPPRFRHHFSHTWLDRGGPEGDLMELNGWSSPQMLRRYGASARSARARRTYDRIMTDT